MVFGGLFGPRILARLTVECSSTDPHHGANSMQVMNANPWRVSQTGIAKLNVDYRNIYISSLTFPSFSTPSIIFYTPHSSHLSFSTMVNTVNHSSRVPTEASADDIAHLIASMDRASLALSRTCPLLLLMFHLLTLL